MKRSSVLPSVCPSIDRSTAYGGFAAERPTGRRSIDYPALSSSGAAARRSAANAGSVMLTADVES